MTIKALGYLVLGVSDVDAWRRYSSDVLGVQTTDVEEGGLRLRVDSRDWRIAIEPSGEDDIVAAGWEVAGPDDFAAVVAKLQAGNVAVEVDSALAAKRGVLGVARFVDPAGIPGEIFWGATERLERPFVSPEGVSGFVTGDQGIGHVVLAVTDPAAMHQFYTGLLGFRLSDFIDIHLGPNMVLPVEFLHCNRRHHTLAFAPAPIPKKLIHFMLEALTVDDVGFALDRVATHNAVLAVGLGRHVNDYMFSFYCVTPSGFEVEYGCGARTIDDATWVPVRHDRTSAWGHKPTGLATGPQA